MNDKVRPAAGDDSVSVRAWVAQVGEQFAADWAAGPPPRLEDYLPPQTHPARGELIAALLPIELAHRRRRGETPRPEDYRARWSSEWTWIEQAFQREVPATPVAGEDCPTLAHGATPTPTSSEQSHPVPTRLGRYAIRRKLGEGGFGDVYLAYDEQLRREVAVKVPHPHLVRSVVDAELYRSEAQTVASLDHPHIVPVFDIGGTAEFPCYIVSKYVPGSTLRERMKAGVTFREAAQWVLQVAEALQHAHEKELVHRDIKPGNILLDSEGQPYVVDFGLALQEADAGRGPQYAGTPAYMSPEQARGEGHRVDGRSDIYSLGVVLYELLTGRRPFEGDDRSLLARIARDEVRPPRQRNKQVPPELDRICLKCLANRAADRYSAAADLAEDLRCFLDSQELASLPPAALVTSSAERRTPSDTAQPGSAITDADRSAPRIVPKGLRSFDEHDADFFLELLPGPRDRAGLPDSIRFWKTRIEAIDAEKAFRVGLIYGPSGCGKSSLVKAGLLPRLRDHVHAVYVEATADDTEARLIAGIRKQCPGLRAGGGLKTLLMAMRRGEGLAPGHKVLLVLDQFEQWLHAQRNDDNTELVEALRQCDGGHLQGIVMVRDDFWLAVSRLSRELEIRFLDGHNSGLVDLFDSEHARKVLGALGRAYARLPEHVRDISDEQREFLKQSVSGLAQEGKVICVRLALFAEMMKSRPWTPDSLREVGGTEGVGVTFLEETFSASTAPPEHRYHQKAARAVLKALLPEAGTDIKGHMRSYEELLEASAYGPRIREFSDLVQILDNELRLLTPTDPAGTEAAAEDDAATPADRTQRYYQLTHDYLVPALRDWLTRKQRETRRGRAELRLAERSAVWNAKPEPRHLPSWWEYLSIAWLTTRQHRTPAQQRMLRAAGRYHGVRAASGLALVLVLAGAIQQFVAHERRASAAAIAAQQRQSVRTTLDALGNSHGLAVPFVIRDLERLPVEIVREELDQRYAAADGSQKLPYAYARAELEGQADPALLVAAIPTAPAEEVVNLAAALKKQRDTALVQLNQATADATAKGDWERKSRLAIVALHLADRSIAADMLQIENRPDPIQRTVSIDTFPDWSGNLAALKTILEKTEDGALRSGICLGLGSITEPAAEAIAAWGPLLADWHVNEPDSGTHSASGFALRQWGLPLPLISGEKRHQAGYAWELRPTGVTMLRIPAGELIRQDEGISRQKVKLSEFWLADREVTVGLFEQFVNDRNYPGEKPADWGGYAQFVSPTIDHPVQQVSWDDAVMFCNWLSWKEGLQPCYAEGKRRERNEEGQEVVVGTWELIPETNGYRLPTDAQWEYACRAGTTTTFSCGDDEEMLRAYGVFQASRSDRCASKLCSGWGLFDMHGNVFEWCQDWYGEYGTGAVSDPTGPDAGSSRVYRGGGWSITAPLCRSADRSTDQPSFRTFDLGFRLARVPRSSSQAQEPAGGAASGSR